MDDQLFDASLTKCQNKEHEQSAYNIHPTDTSVKVTAQVLDDLLSLCTLVPSGYVRSYIGSKYVLFRI